MMNGIMSFIDAKGFTCLILCGSTSSVKARSRPSTSRTACHSAVSDLYTFDLMCEAYRRIIKPESNRYHLNKASTRTTGAVIADETKLCLNLFIQTF